MRWIHARNFLLAGVLTTGFNSVRAKILDQALSEVVSVTSAYSSLASNGLSQNATRMLHLDFLMVKQKSVSRSSSLFLPEDPNELKVKEFRPLTLVEVEKLVELNNPSLKAASIQIEQERSKLRSAIASWYPSVDLTANGLPQYLMADSYRNPDYSTSPNTRSSQWKTDFTAKVKWNIVDPARVPQIASARDSFERSRETYLISLRDVRLQASIKFFELQRADQGVLVGKKSLKASLLSQKDANARFDAGLASKFETLEAKTQLARDNRLLKNALRDQEIARRSLAELINLPQNVIPIASTPLTPIGIWQTSLEESIVSAYSFREELDKYLLEISIDNSKANEALAAAQPVLSLVNTYNASRTQGQLNVSEPSEKDYSWTSTNTIGLTATWKIFDGGSAKSLYRLNKQRAREKEINFILERNKIRQQVEESYFSLIAAKDAVSSTRDEIIAQREVLRLARLRFNSGVSNQREVLENQRDLRQAEINYADAISSYNTSLAQLRRRTGLDQTMSCEEYNLSLPNQKDGKKRADKPLPSIINGLCEAVLSSL
ncbi:TolC family protein [Prochlorococcus sp. MIT 1341]|uniref:TolC family protein n=1 Tax=Prochlorococcus sp. MIT 1341 TaxID=3096221 RepID=UPI002A75F200|nr:TolC family protein [Prochlorococcus sp. MIT 1341]